MRRTATYFPLGDGTLKDDIFVLLSLSNNLGQPLPGKTQEWIAAATKIVRGMRASLKNDGDLQLSPTA